MPLALTVDTIDSVPEPMRTLYVEREGKFHLEVDGLPDVKGLKSALDGERSRAAELEKSMKQWAKLGKAPTEVEEMLASERKKAEDALLKAGKFDEVLSKHLGEAKQERDTAVGAATKERDAALEVAKRAIRRTELSAALVKAKATPEGLDLLAERLGRRIDVKFADDGTETVSILEADGKTPMVGSGKGGLATFEDLVKEATKGYPSLFEGTGGGGGAPNAGNRGGAKTITRAEWEKLPPGDQRAKHKDGFKIVD